MNKIILDGMIVSELEVKNIGFSICNFILAVERIGAKAGKQNIDFFKVESVGKNADLIKQYFKKGDKIYIEGIMILDEVKKNVNGKLEYRIYPKVKLTSVKIN